MRILVFSERLRPPFDEGIKNVALNLARWLAESHEVVTLTTEGAGNPESGVESVPAANRLLLSHHLRRRVRALAPDRVCYVPSASMTPWSFLRTRVLFRHSGGKPTTMVALQGRRVTWLTRVFASRGVPERIIVQSRRTARSLSRLGARVTFAPVGVDRERFSPATPAQREAVRRRFGVDAKARVVLHVGHLNRNRNVQVLAAMQRIDGVQTILLASASTRSDHALASELEAAGVRIVTGALPDSESIYQLADLYVFPCSPDRPVEQTPAIETPLSVLEAMACDLPVVMTRFGGLPDLFDAGDGVVFVKDAEDGEEWCRAAVVGLASGRGHTRAHTRQLTWQRFAEAAIGPEQDQA